MKAFKETHTGFLFFSIGTGTMFSIWLLGFLGIITFEDATNPYFVAFQVLFVLPAFSYMIYRLFHLKNRIQFEKDHLVLRSIHLFPKAIKIPKVIIIDAEWFPFETCEDTQNALRIILSDSIDCFNYSGDSYFNVINGNFECLMFESKLEIELIAQEIKKYIKVEQNNKLRP